MKLKGLFLHIRGRSHSKCDINVEYFTQNDKKFKVNI
jgi:hypothetical protein